LLRKILTGRAGFADITECSTEDDKATAVNRSSTALGTLVVVLGTIAHKALCAKKRRLSDKKEVKFTRHLCENYFELFDAHEDAAPDEEASDKQWNTATDNVLRANVAEYNDFGATPGTPLLIVPRTGEFLVYVWNQLLHDLHVYTEGKRKRDRLESKGNTAEKHYCYQVCLRSVFIDMLKSQKKRVGGWFDVDPDGETSGKIIIHTPEGKALDKATRYLRCNGQAGSGPSLMAFNALQQRGGGVAILEPNCTDKVNYTHDPWSEQYSSIDRQDSEYGSEDDIGGQGANKNALSEGAQAAEQMSEDDDEGSQLV
jgi:hypothetical protein